uniref:Leucine-rich repeat-containing N-terminal plant-type domain-containing protein n=1 Tax=Oryza meridionalis TaxID=40149 RepID=A0A0E0EWR4_9ORYZ
MSGPRRHAPTRRRRTEKATALCRRTTADRSVALERRGVGRPTRGARVEAVVALAFKTAVTDDPSGALSSWSDADVDPCRWAGVTCVNMLHVVVGATRRRRRHRREEPVRQYLQIDASHACTANLF